METLRTELEDGSWAERLIAPDEVLLGWRAAILRDEGTRDLLHGRDTAIQPEPGILIAPGDRCRAYSDAGEFLAILSCREADRWRPEKVFAQP
jgi:hypothetical protein